MIGFDFDYYKPETVKQAVELFDKLESSGKQAIYYGGGSEFISMARNNNVHADAVIDIKGIEECNEYKVQGKNLIIGAGVTLTEIAQGDLFPLLTLAVKRIADHTMQGKITLGGNICGTIVYKESILPLLLSESSLIIGDKNGQREELISDIFHERLQLEKGEILVKILVPKVFLSLPYLHVKRAKNEVIDYPLISMTALKIKSQIRMSFSGLGEYPFRSTDIEDILNDKKISLEDKIKKSVKSIEDKIRSDISGSKEYKKFILHNVLEIALRDLGGIDKC